jgi:hypothetical protein
LKPISLVIERGRRGESACVRAGRRRRMGVCTAVDCRALLRVSNEFARPEPIQSVARWAALVRFVVAPTLFIEIQSLNCVATSSLFWCPPPPLSLTMYRRLYAVNLLSYLAIAS